MEVDYSRSLDTIYTYIYKTAIQIEYPVRRCRIIQNDKNDGQSLNITSYADFRTRFTVMSPLSIVYRHPDKTPNEIHKLYPQFELVDLVYAYYQRFTENLIGDVKFDDDSQEYIELLSTEFNSEILTMLISTLSDPVDINDVRSLHNSYLDFLDKLVDEFFEDKRIVDRINEIENTLNSTFSRKYTVSDINKTKISYAFDVSITDPEYISLDDLAKSEFGINVFNQSSTSNDVPLIQYNDIGKSGTSNQLYRIYRGETDRKIDYKKLVTAGGDTKLSLYYRIYTGSYETLEYRVPQNKILLTENIDSSRAIGNKEYLIDRFVSSNDVDMSVDTTSPSRDSIKGWFNMYNINMNDVVFMDLLSLSPEFSSYILMDESVESYPNKSNLTVRTVDIPEFMNAADLRLLIEKSGVEMPRILRAIIKSETIETGISYPVLSELTTMSPGNYVTIKFDNVSDENAAIHFRYLMGRLFRFYESQTSRIIGLYSKFFTGIDTRGIRGEKPKTVKTKSIKMLKDYDSKISKERGVPNLIVKLYARECEKYQPTAIEPGDVTSTIDIKTGKTVYTWNGNPSLQVMPFPNMIDPYWFFVCNHSEHRYPGLKINNLSNKREYPFIPCCYKNDSMNKTNNNWYQYLRGQKPVSKFEGFVDKEVLTRFTIVPGRFSVISSEVSSVLRTLDPDNDYYRYGSIIGPNSFLHSIIAAVDPRYQQLTSVSKIEEYMAGIRFSIANTINTNIMSQETFDMSPESRYKNLANFNIYLDPKLYYRALEEYFGINIYVFTPNGICSPRFKLFNVRYYDSDRPTVLVYEHYGGKPDSMSYPQVDLMVSSPRGKPKINIFTVTKVQDTELSSKVHILYQNSLKSITWQVESEMSGLSLLQARLDMYSVFDYKRIIKSIGGTIIAQTIDDLGKTRIVQFTVPEVSIIMYVQPGQPSDVDNIMADDLTNGLPPIDSVIRVKGLQNPTRITISDSKIIGLWYSYLDLDNAFFIPVRSSVMVTDQSLPVRSSVMDLVSSLPQGPPSLSMNPTGSRYLRLQKLRRTASLYMQLLLVAYGKYHGALDTFIDEYLTINISISTTDTANIYDMSQLVNSGTRWLPNFNDIYDVVDFIKEKTTGIIDDYGKFQAYSEKFYQGLVYFLKNYEKTITGDVKPQPKLLHDILTQESDFKARANEIIFAGKDRITSWVNLVTSPDYISIEIHKNIQIGVTDVKQSPYVYTSLDGKIYIIQNTYSKSLRSAIQLGYTWLISKINLGYSRVSDFTESDLPPYKVYRITADGQLEIESDNSNGNPEYLRVLNYSGLAYTESKRVFGAILELL